MRNLLLTIPFLVSTGLGAQVATYTYLNQKRPYVSSRPKSLRT